MIASPQRLGVTVLTALVLAGCGGSRAQAPAAQASPTSVHATVSRLGTVRPEVIIAGLIAPHQNVALSSSLTEPARLVNVREGQHVSRGEVLAVLATDDLRASLDAAQRTAAADRARTQQSAYQAQYTLASGVDTVAADRAAVRQAQANRTNDEIDLDRYDALSARGFVSQQQLDGQRAKVASDEQTVRAAAATLQAALDSVRVNGTQSSGLQASTVATYRAQAQAARAQATQIQRQIARATIRSPIDGIVVNRNLNVGEYPGTRQIFTLQENAHVYAVLDASAAQISQISAGTAASVVRANGARRRHFAGTVEGVLPQTTPGSTNFAVKVDLPNPDGVLAAGIPVIGTLMAPPVRGVEVPVRAFLDDAHDGVMVVRGGRAHRVAVREVTSDGTRAIVTKLPAGVRVVTNGALGLASGTRVALR